MMTFRRCAASPGPLAISRRKTTKHGFRFLITDLGWCVVFSLELSANAIEVALKRKNSVVLEKTTGRSRKNHSAIRLPATPPSPHDALSSAADRPKSEYNHKRPGRRGFGPLGLTAFRDLTSAAGNTPGILHS